MKRALSIFLLISFIILAVFSSALSCGEKKAQLPEYKIGNQWVYKMEYKDLIHDVTIDVTDTDVVDNKECYLIVWNYQPALEGVIADMSTWIDKDTIFPTRVQMTGSMMGLPYSMIVNFSYVFHDQEWWPLEVGKEIRISENIDRTTKALGLENEETERKASTYEIVRIEEITILAGAFECFKIVEHADNGMKLSETWYSDDVKNDVKYIDYEEGYTIELKSYSL